MFMARRFTKIKIFRVAINDNSVLKGKRTPHNSPFTSRMLYSVHYSTLHFYSTICAVHVYIYMHSMQIFCMHTFSEKKV